MIAVRKMRLLIVCALCVALSQESAAQSDQILRLFTTVTDRNGEVVSDLAKDDFVIVDNGKPQMPSFVDGGAEPVGAIVMIDVSASMADTFQSLVTAVDEFMSGLGPQDEVRAVTFSEQVQVSSRFTADRRELIGALRTSAFGNGTRFYDALLASFDLFKGRPGLHVVITITDGDDTYSRASRSDVVDRERMDDVIVYAIGLHTRYFNGQRVVQNVPDRALKNLAEQTGGSYFDAPEAANVRGIFTRIRQELNGHYVVGFSPQRRDDRIHKLVVQARRPGVMVHSRQWYLASPSNR